MLLNFRRLLQSTALQLILLNYVQVVISFAASVFFANTLDSNAYGIYCSYLFLAGIVGSFIAFGADKTLVRDMVQSSEPKNVFIASMYGRVGIFSLCLLCTVVVSTFISKQGEEYLLGMVVFIAGATALAPTAAYDVSKRMTPIQISFFCERFLFIATAVFILLLQPIRDHLFCVSILLALNVFIKLFVLAWQWAFCGITFCRPDIKIWKSSWKIIVQNIPVLIASFSGLMYWNVCPLLLRYMQGASEVALYSVAFQFASLIIICQSQILRTVIPGISEFFKPSRSRGAVVTEYFRIVRKGLVLTGILCITVFIGASFVVERFYEPEYRDVVFTMIPLMFFLLLYWPSMVASQCLLASGGEKEYGRINVKTLVVGLVVCPFLCVNFGSIGVAVGVCVRELINVFCYTRTLFLRHEKNLTNKQFTLSPKTRDRNTCKLNANTRAA